MIYDIIIVGGGSAGLTAAIYATRGGLKTLLIEREITGGRITTTHLVENYPGFPDGIGGFELGMLMTKQAEKFGAKIVYEEVTAMNLEGEQKLITTTSNKYLAKAVVLAMGTTARTLGLPKEKELIGYGISYCATCDGAFFRGKDVVVVGGGNTAVSEAIYLASLANKVHLIHRRDSYRAETIRISVMDKTPNIIQHKNCVVVDTYADPFLTGIKVKNNKTQEEYRIDAQGMFVAIGSDPNTALIKSQIKLDEYGYIEADCNQTTNLQGVFTCGDIRKGSLRQVVTACGDGAMAAQNAIEYVLSLK